MTPAAKMPHARPYTCSSSVDPMRGQTARRKAIHVMLRRLGVSAGRANLWYEFRIAIESPAMQMKNR